jgi:hypothetical protein
MNPSELSRREWLKTSVAAGAAAFCGHRSSTSARAADADAGAAIHITSRRELFVDGFLIGKLDGARLKLHEPRLAGVALKFDQPWEGLFSACPTVILDGATYRMYYRGLPKSGVDGSENESTCYAESRDGITWTKPNLGLFEAHGARDNNVVLRGSAPCSHNFSPFLDTRPGVPAAERFKAVGGSAKSGLIAFVSADGIRWRKLRDEPVFTKGAFDSQNLAFWSEAEQCYVLYFRTFTGGGADAHTWQPKGLRTISRTVSKDFIHWEEPRPMTFSEPQEDHLYTNQTHPYFRAPHIYIALPMRFMPGRKVLSNAQAAALGVNMNYASDCAETVFMTSRGGWHYDRTFMEGFIRPGTDPGNWVSRAGIAALGVVPTGPAEISLYKQAHYAQPSGQLLRYTLRTDGFASVNAPYRGGELLTKPLKFTGKELVLNFSTGAAGGIRVEIQDVDGKPLPGFALADATEIIGDEIERVATWKAGADVSKLAGRPVRLRFAMKDADLFSIRFR